MPGLSQALTTTWNYWKLDFFSKFFFLIGYYYLVLSSMNLNTFFNYLKGMNNFAESCIQFDLIV